MNATASEHSRAIGREVRRIRGKMPQIALADAMKIPNYQLSKLESGRAEWSYPLVCAAARALNVSVRRLHRVVEMVWHDEQASRAAS